MALFGRKEPLNAQKNIDRTTQLLSDYKRITELFKAHKYISIKEVFGAPPERYHLLYKIDGLEKSRNAIEVKNEHVVEIALPPKYPSAAPVCKRVTALFHPNVSDDGIDIKEYWTPGTALADLIVRIGQMITFQKYDTAHPVSIDAAKWADRNASMLPLSTVDLSYARPGLPKEDAQGTKVIIQQQQPAGTPPPEDGRKTEGIILDGGTEIISIEGEVSESVSQNAEMRKTAVLREEKTDTAIIVPAEFQPPASKTVRPENVTASAAKSAALPPAPRAPEPKPAAPKVVRAEQPAAQAMKSVAAQPAPRAPEPKPAAPPVVRTEQAAAPAAKGPVPEPKPAAPTIVRTGQAAAPAAKGPALEPKPTAPTIVRTEQAAAPAAKGPVPEPKPAAPTIVRAQQAPAPAPEKPAAKPQPAEPAVILTELSSAPAAKSTAPVPTSREPESQESVPQAEERRPEASMPAVQRDLATGDTEISSQKDAVYCSTCGGRNALIANFCSHCGSKILRESTPAKCPTTKVLTLSFLVSVPVAIIAVGAALVLTQQNRTAPQNPVPPPAVPQAAAAPAVAAPAPEKAALPKQDSANVTPPAQPSPPKPPRTASLTAEQKQAKIEEALRDAQTYLNLGSFEEALNKYMYVLKLDPKNDDALDGLRTVRDAKDKATADSAKTK
jgi:ubiquitin-protein ligase